VTMELAFDELVNETPFAWHVVFDGRRVALSKSACELFLGDRIVTVPEWLAIKEGEMEEKHKMSFDEATGRLQLELSMHVGEEHAIGAAELYEAVFGEKITHKINHTKQLRKLITALRKKGSPIGSTSSQTGGGYYICRSGSELDDYCRRLRRRGLHSLELEARARKIALPELLGQMSLNLERGADAGGGDGRG